MPIGGIANMSIEESSVAVVQQEDESREFFEEGESQLLHSSVRHENRVMPEAVFHQTRGGKNGTEANEMAPPDSQIFQRRINLGQVFNCKEAAIVGQKEEQE